MRIGSEPRCVVDRRRPLGVLSIPPRLCAHSRAHEWLCTQKVLKRDMIPRQDTAPACVCVVYVCVRMCVCVCAVCACREPQTREHVDEHQYKHEKEHQIRV